MISAETYRDAACIYETVRGYAPLNNDVDRGLGAMAVFAETCALIAKIAGLEVLRSDSNDEPVEVPTAEEIENLQAELLKKREQYLKSLARRV